MSEQWRASRLGVSLSTMRSSSAVWTKVPFSRCCAHTYSSMTRRDTSFERLWRHLASTYHSEPSTNSRCPTETPPPKVSRDDGRRGCDDGQPSGWPPYVRILYSVVSS